MVNLSANVSIKIVKKTYTIFLRAINVSGKNIIKMKELVDVLISNGFDEVKTYIQSGNLILKSELNSDELTNKINQLIEQHFQISTEYFVYKIDDLKNIFSNNPYFEVEDGSKVFLAFLGQEPKIELLNEFSDQYQFVFVDQVLFFYLPEGIGKSKFNVSLIEKKMNLKATARNVNTIRKILELGF